MGQIMGSYSARNVDLYMDDKPTFDHQVGFPYERKERGDITRLNFKYYIQNCH